MIRPALATRIAQAALAAGLLAGTALPALANGASGQDDAPPLGAQAGVSRKVDLSIGRSLIVDLPRDAKEVFVANPKVANAVVRSTRKVFVIGMENGATSIFVRDAEGRQMPPSRSMSGATSTCCSRPCAPPSRRRRSRSARRATRCS
jgi:pilus assembly protein CpaC